METDKRRIAMTVRNLHFAYGKHPVLKGVDLKIPEGEITTILGANGCGKSTLFNLMTKNLQPAKGDVYVYEKNIRNLKLKEFAREVSIVHQNNTAARDMTVEKLVAMGRVPYQSFLKDTEEEDEKRISWAMEVTGVADLAKREVLRLSGGQRQRVWIALALAQNTKILFLDEPTTYLDIRYQIEILELVRRLNREFHMTIIMVLHDINQAIAFSDRVIGLKNGKVAVTGRPEDVITEENIYALYGIGLNVIEQAGRKIVLAAERKKEM